MQKSFGPILLDWRERIKRKCDFSVILVTYLVERYQNSIDIQLKDYCQKAQNQKKPTVKNIAQVL